MPTIISFCGISTRDYKGLSVLETTCIFVVFFAPNTDNKHDFPIVKTRPTFLQALRIHNVSEKKKKKIMF